MKGFQRVAGGMSGDNLTKVCASACSRTESRKKPLSFENCETRIHIDLSSWAQRRVSLQGRPFSSTDPLTDLREGRQNGYFVSGHGPIVEVRSSPNIVVEEH